MSDTTQQHQPGDIVNGHVLGHDGSWQPLPPAAPAKKKHRVRNAVLGTAMIVTIYGIAQAASGGGDDESSKVDQAVAAQSGDKGDSKPAEDAKPVDVMQVQAKAILKEFEENEAAADQKYSGKVLQVTGIVDKIDTELFDEDEYIIQIGGGGEFEFFTVNADDQSADAVASLKKGDKITVIGEFEDGGDLGVELSESKIV